jgi:hypothetical protein
VWFTWDGRYLYFNTGRSTQKARNLAGNDWTVAHLGDGEDVILLEGRAIRIDGRTRLAELDRAHRSKYVDPHSGATAGFPESEFDIPYRLDVERIVTWEYGVVATRTDFVPDGRQQWIQTAPNRI